MTETKCPTHPIAVIGMAGRFPGAGDPDALWRNLIAGRESITRFPGGLAADGNRLVGARGMIALPGCFDAGFFGIDPDEARQLDPQQRIFLECAWEAFEDAGCDPATFAGGVGVFAGIAPDTYAAAGDQGENAATSGDPPGPASSEREILSARVSRTLGLSGPSMTLHAAGSTSLVAICQAATALAAGQCGMAVAGAVSIGFPQDRLPLVSEDGEVSPDGVCRPFDAAASGQVEGHGCGVVLLKRLSDALADRDPIHAVLKGWALNHDAAGRTSGKPAAIDAQAEVVTLAHAAAGIQAADVSYIEAHASGIPAIDALELAALTKAFRDGGADQESICAISSAKPHIGHLGGAAGVVGLIKTILQLRHRKIPALLHFKSAHPDLPLAGSPIKPLEREIDWNSGEKPRLAGVNGLSIGGTNAHLVVEEAASRPAAESKNSVETLFLSARSAAALKAMSDRLANHLEAENPRLADVAFTLATGRRAFPWRRALHAADTAGAIAALRADQGDAGSPSPQRGVVFLFPGHGRQHPEMTRALYDAEPVFRNAVDECAVLLRPLIHHDIRSTLYPSEHERDDARTDIHRSTRGAACILVVSYALARLWISRGIRPAMVIGHGIGEYTAAVVAGVFKLENALQLLANRSSLIDSLPEGGMLAIHADASSLKLHPHIDLAAVNSPSDCTVSGPREALETYQNELAAAAVSCQPLHTSHALHSAMVEPILTTFAEDAAMIPASDPQIPWISTTTGMPVDAQTLADPSYWSRQIRHTVRFSQALEAAFAHPDKVLLEVGPGKDLGEFAKRHPKRGDTPVVSTLPSGDHDLTDVAAASCGLWIHGVTPERSALLANPQRTRLHLPTYPFEREDLWIEKPAKPHPKAAGQPAAAIVEPATGIKAAAAPSGLPPVLWPSHLAQPLSGHAAVAPGLPDTPRGEALESFITRYQTRTAASAAHAGDSSSSLANPDAVAGFDPRWKEISYPIVTRPADKTRLRDLDCNEYVDASMDGGNAYFGHAPEWLNDALARSLSAGAEAGAEVAGPLAKAICQLTGMERATFRNSGAEALTTAMRIARTITGRDRIACFLGDPHGGSDVLRVHGSWTDGIYQAIPTVPGIPHALVEHILVLDFADPASLEILRTHAHELAAVMVAVAPRQASQSRTLDFMRALRELTAESGCAFILNEIATGFRCAPGGARSWLGVKPDMVVHGEMTAAGLPIGVLAGKNGFLAALDGGTWNDGDDDPDPLAADPLRPHQGFLPHPLALAAAASVVRHLNEQGPRLQTDLAERVARLCRTLNRHLDQVAVPLRLEPFFASAVIHLTESPAHVGWLRHFLRANGVFVGNGPSMHFSTCHTDEDFKQVMQGFAKAVADMRDAGLFPTPAAHTARPPVAFPGFDTVPSTLAQRSILHAASASQEANCTFNQSRILRMHGPLDVMILRSAIHDLLVHHPELRSGFTADGLSRHIHPAARAAELVEHDFSGMDPSSLSVSLPLSLMKRSETSAPFDLEKGPLIRFQLVHLSGQQHELILTVHQLVCENHSPATLVHQLAAAYNARLGGGLPDFPPPLPAAEPAMAVPQVLPVHLEMKTRRGAIESAELDSGRFERLAKAAPVIGGSLPATLLATFATMLHRATGGDELRIALRSEGRTLPPLRLLPATNQSFRSFATGIATRLEELHDARNAATQEIPNPAQIFFSFDPGDHAPLALDQLECSLETNPPQFVHFDLSFHLARTGRQWVVECAYDADRHNPATIRGWIDGFGQVAEAVLSQGADVAIHDLDMLTAADRLKLDQWNATSAALPQEPTIHRFFEEQAYHHPHAVALRAGERSFTYQELDRHANALAFELQRHGVLRETLVAIDAEHRAESIVAMLAVLKAGGACLTIDPADPRGRIAHLLRDSAASLLLTQRSLVHTLPDDPSCRRIFIDDALLYSSERPACDSAPGDLAFVTYVPTAGGAPKGVALDHRAVIARIGWARSIYQPEELSGVLFAPPLGGGIPLFELFLPLASGGSVILADTPEKLRDHPHRTAITMIHGNRRTIRGLLDSGLLPPSLRAVGFHNENPGAELLERLAQARPGISALAFHGCAEVTVCATFTRLLPEATATLGRPVSNTTAHLVNKRGGLVPPGVTGELLLGGAGLARGYLHDPQLTAETFITHPELGRVYRTGERACFNHSGELVPLGRSDRRMHLDGIRIEPGEIESLLEKEATVERAHVRIRDGSLVAFLTLRSSAPDNRAATIPDWRIQWDRLYKPAAPTPEEEAASTPEDLSTDGVLEILRRRLATFLPHAMMPSVLQVLDAFPLTADGTIDEDALLHFNASGEAGHSMGSTSTAPTATITVEKTVSHD
jgi:amino acid adenylation domain-containing protein